MIKHKTNHSSVTPQTFKSTKTVTEVEVKKSKLDMN
jgi:hypothetical protein